MNQETFALLWDDLDHRARMVGRAKGAVYTGTEGDRLANFKRLQRHQRVATPERALWNLASKHFDALVDYIMRLDEAVDLGQTQPNVNEVIEGKEWLEKITDIEVYICRLLPALLVERGILTIAPKEGGKGSDTSSRS
jgi:hypothetical protein